MKYSKLPKNISFLVATLAFAPFSAYAQNSAQALLQDLIDKILRPFANILLVVATVIFLFGVVEYIAGASSESARTTGRSHILWGTVGLAIMISVKFILQILTSVYYPNGS